MYTGRCAHERKNQPLWFKTKAHEQTIELSSFARLWLEKNTVARARRQACGLTAGHGLASATELPGPNEMITLT